MKVKKIIAIALAATLSTSILASCNGGGTSTENTSKTENKTLKVAAIETAYGTEIWKKVIAEFEANNPGVKVELTMDKNLETVIGSKMKSGDYPDVVHLATGRKDALTETMTKDNAIRDLS
ncbi:MAG: carbohydrate ABC transporter substrate-binding protein, partial [Clostridia bacterium]